ncbi:hypothetical protein pb186bvf_009475 [Paramecium bursaria]
MQQPNPQNRIDLDVLKHYYSQQQLQFDREVEQLKFQLTRADQNRLNAEKELLLLQDQAREKQIWNILDQNTFQPNIVQGDRMFRTAKYAIGNMSESERRQQLLMNYYKQQQYQQQLFRTQDIQTNVPELPSQTQLIIPKQKTQQPYQLDQSLLKDLETVRQREQEITKLLLDQYNVQDKAEFQTMLENSSLLQIMQDLKQKGERAIVTPNIPVNKLDIERNIKTSGGIAQVTFLNDYQPKEPTEIEFQPDEQAGQTEDLILNESEIPKITEQPYDYEEADQSFEDLDDPIDDQIYDLLNGIQQIIQNPKTSNNDYEKLKQNLQNNTQNKTLLKPFIFTKVAPPNNTQNFQKTYQSGQSDDKDKLDQLIKGLQD